MRSHMWSSKPSAAVNPEPSVWNNVFNTVEPDWSGLFTVFLISSSVRAVAEGHVRCFTSYFRPIPVKPRPIRVIEGLSYLAWILVKSAAPGTVSRDTMHVPMHEY